MNEVGFKLLGHDNPLKDYPAPVVPVGHLDNRLVAVFQTGDTPEIVELEDCNFVLHEDLCKELLRIFDYKYHRLFAFSQTKVFAYEAKHESEFFRALIKDQSFSKENPFLRLSLAKAINSQEIIREELTSCVLKLNLISQTFADSWYEKQRNELYGYWGNDLLLPIHWQDLIEASNSIQSKAFNEVPNVYSEIKRSSQPTSHHYIDAYNLLNRLSFRDYKNASEYFGLLEEAEKSLELASKEEGNLEGVVATLIQCERARLKFYSQNYGEAEQIFRQIIEACTVAQLPDEIAESEEYLYRIAMHTRLEQQEPIE